MNFISAFYTLIVLLISHDLVWKKRIRLNSVGIRSINRLIWHTVNRLSNYWTWNIVEHIANVAWSARHILVLALILSCEHFLGALLSRPSWAFIKLCIIHQMTILNLFSSGSNWRVQMKLRDLKRLDIHLSMLHLHLVVLTVDSLVVLFVCQISLYMCCIYLFY